MCMCAHTYAFSENAVQLRSINIWDLKNEMRDYHPFMENTMAVKSIMDHSFWFHIWEH